MGDLKAKLNVEVKHFLRKYIDTDNIVDFCIENIDIDYKDLADIVVFCMDEDSFKHLYEDLIDPKFKKFVPDKWEHKRSYVAGLIDSGAIKGQAMEYIDGEIRSIVHDILMNFNTD
jgi:hypothetical protein